MQYRVSNQNINNESNKTKQCQQFIKSNYPFHSTGLFKWQQWDSNPQPLRFPLNHLAKLASLAKWLSVSLRSKWLWVRIPLLSLKLQIWRLLRARSSLTSRQSIECRFALKLVRGMIITYSHWSLSISPATASKPEFFMLSGMYRKRCFCQTKV